MCACARCAGTLEQVLNAEWHRWNFRSEMNFMHPASPHTSWIMIPGLGYPCLDCFIFHTQLERLWWLKSCLNLSPLIQNYICLRWRSIIQWLHINSLSVWMFQTFSWASKFLFYPILTVTNVANAHDILFLLVPIFRSVICLCINWIKKSFPELHKLIM